MPPFPTVVSLLHSCARFTLRFLAFLHRSPLMVPFGKTAMTLPVLRDARNSPNVKGTTCKHNSGLLLFTVVFYGKLPENFVATRWPPCFPALITFLRSELLRFDRDLIFDTQTITRKLYAFCQLTYTKPMTTIPRCVSCLVRDTSNFYLLTMVITV